MGTLALGYFNRVCSRATVSGGSWLAALPSSNVRTPERAAVARSSTDATADTKLQLLQHLGFATQRGGVVHHDVVFARQSLVDCFLELVSRQGVNKGRAGDHANIDFFGSQRGQAKSQTGSANQTGQGAGNECHGVP